jgi:hypothetical protein
MEHISAADNHVASQSVCRYFVSLPKERQRLDRLTTGSRYIAEKRPAVVFFASREGTVVPQVLGLAPDVIADSSLRETQG